MGKASGALGFGQGEGNVTLEAVGDCRARLTYSYRANVGGKVAAVGQRMLGTVTKLLIGQFFRGFDRRLTSSGGGQTSRKGFRQIVRGARRMKPVAFEYCRPDTVDEAMELLAEFGGDASIISGGLSLGAMLNMRLVRPTALVDINRLHELADIEIGDATATTGALVRQAAALELPGVMSGVPLLAKVLPWVGHYQTRSRGTLGGSAAHADPSAEIPLTLVTLGGAVRLRSPGGSRDVGAGFLPRAFDDGPTGRRGCYRSDLATAARRTGYAFEEIAQHRHGDFAIVAIAAEATVGDDGNIADLSFGLGGVEDRPPLVADTASCIGKPATMATAEITWPLPAVDPMVDLQANADYRRQLVRVLGARVVSSRFADATHSGRP